MEPDDQTAVGLMFKSLARVPLFLGNPAGDVGRETEDDLVVAVAADGAEATASCSPRAETRPGGRTSRPWRNDRMRCTANVRTSSAEMAVADRVPAVFDEDQVVRVKCAPIRLVPARRPVEHLHPVPADDRRRAEAQNDSGS